jgi:hypothetical protein
MDICRTFVRVNNSMATECLVVRRLYLNSKNDENSKDCFINSIYV